MLKIWGRASSSNVQKVLWCCAELGIAFERVDLGGPFGGNQDPDYLALNPNGLVPTVRDGDLVLWETNTIYRYLAATHNGEWLRPAGRGSRPRRALDGLAVVDGRAADGGIALWPHPHPAGTARPGRDRGGAAQRPRRLDDRRGCARGPPLAALSLSEIVLGTLVYRWHAFPIERPPLKRLRAWYERMRERPGFKAHIEVPIT